MATIGELLRHPALRLLTLTGAGGVGKTRVALEVARTCGASFPDGVLFVPLAEVRNPILVPSTIAQVFGVHDVGHRSLTEGIASVIRERTLLLVLDNFEHVAVAAPQVVDLLAICPGLTCLVTSRAVLRVSGEHAFPVPPLALPPAATSTSSSRASLSPAVRLFVSRAQAAQPGFALTDGNAADVERICRRLDGLPLALELAAARTRFLSTAELAEHLDGAAASPLHILTGGPRDAPDRQRGLRHAIAWSYTLLHSTEQAAFRRLGVFIDGFTMPAAEALLQREDRTSFDVGDIVAALVDQSLLWRRDDPSGVSRYGMLETIREFALERLADDDDDESAAHAAHAEYFLALVEATAPRFHEAHQTDCLRRTAAELANIRAAMAWLDRTGHIAKLARICWALHWFWKFQGHQVEARAWYERVLAAGTALAPIDRQAMLIGATHFAWVLGDADRAEATAWEALDLAQTSGTPFIDGLAHLMLAKVRYWQGDVAVADRLGAGAIARLRQATSWEGRVMLRIALNDVGINVAHAGQAGRGIALLEEALALGEGTGNLHLAGVHWSDLGLATEAAGNQDRARACFAEGLRLLQSAGGEWYVAIPLAGLARGVVQRDPARAACLYGAAEGLRERVGQPNWGLERERDARAVAAMRVLLGDDALARELAAGRAMPLPDVMALALSDATPNESARQPASGLERLSARELEVLRLLVGGLSDRQIAEALYISPRTASKHVGNILAKLGVSSRRKAAAVAVRDHLV